MKVKIEVDNKKLMRNINSANKQIHDNLKKEIITTALTEVETGAKMILTTKGHILTGRLRSSIHTEYTGHVNHTYKDNMGKSFNGKLSESPRNDLDIFVGTNVVYANFIERIDPYLFPAMEKSKAGLQRRLKNILQSI